MIIEGSVIDDKIIQLVHVFFDLSNVSEIGILNKDRGGNTRSIEVLVVMDDFAYAQSLRIPNGVKYASQKSGLIPIHFYLIPEDNYKFTLISDKALWASLYFQEKGEVIYRKDYSKCTNN